MSSGEILRKGENRCLEGCSNWEKKTFGQISFRQQDSFLRKHSGFKMYMNLEAVMKESFRIPQQ